MDNYHHHRHHQWLPMPLPPPPSQGNICPVCSISHYPFCPPYPPLPPPHPPPQNPRFPDYSQPESYNYNFNNYREGFGRQVYDYDNINGEIVVAVEDDGRYKRARVDDEVSYGQQNSFDNERRLKLIRDHGSAASVGKFNNDNNVGFNNNSNGDVNNYQLFEYSQPNRDAGHGHGHGDHLHIHNNQDYWFNNNNQSLSAKGSEYFQMNNHYQNQQHHHQQLPSYGFSNHMRPDGHYPSVNDQGGGYLPPQHENRGQYQHHYPPLPPLPASPPPPVPTEPPLKPSPPPPPPQSSLFPVPVSSSFTNPYLQTKPSTAFYSSEEWQVSSVPKQSSPDKTTIIDAFRLFKMPYWATRPDRIVIILRGLPGSGKSYLAKMIRDLEVENGGNAPRIHSMDDYFMTEVEKVEDSDASKSSSFVRGKKPTVKKVMEYCYEPEMEEAYRDSMLKAFKKTLEEGIFTLVIVDDRNLRVADFAQFWVIAKRSGYEVYISEATYKDPAGCAARNVHGFTLDEIKSMAEQWEEAPALYLQLDIKSLFHGDDLKKSGIQEVDMDTEDGTSDDNRSGLQERKAERTRTSPLEDDALHGGERWDAEEDHPRGGGKELLKSKWSDDLDENDTEGSDSVKGNLNALSGLIQAYGKKGKSVRWSDQVGATGFSISAAKKTIKSLVIGPGAGYNLKSNPLAEEGSPTSTHGTGESRRQSVFQERLRAERESFKAIFDKRRRRIGGLDLEEE